VVFDPGGSRAPGGANDSEENGGTDPGQERGKPSLQTQKGNQTKR
jgi:hypothetical protein